jgi:hypothetical protein
MRLIQAQVRFLASAPKLKSVKHRFAKRRALLPFVDTSILDRRKRVRQMPSVSGLSAGLPPESGARFYATIARAPRGYGV